MSKVILLFSDTIFPICPLTIRIWEMGSYSDHWRNPHVDVLQVIIGEMFHQPIGLSLSASLVLRFLKKSSNRGRSTSVFHFPSNLFCRWICLTSDPINLTSYTEARLFWVRVCWIRQPIGMNLLLRSPEKLTGFSCGSSGSHFDVRFDKRCRI